MLQKNTKQFAILSSIPPPFGGVTVHIERLSFLLRQSGITFRIYEQQGKSIPELDVVPIGHSFFKTLKFLITVPEPIIHLHTSSISAIEISLLILLLRKKKVLLTIHNEKPMRKYKQMCLSCSQLLFKLLLKKNLHNIS